MFSGKKRSGCHTCPVPTKGPGMCCFTHKCNCGEGSDIVISLTQKAVPPETTHRAPHVKSKLTEKAVTPRLPAGNKMFSTRALGRPRAGRLFYLCMGPPGPPSFPCHVPPHTLYSRPSSLRGFSCHPLPSDSCLSVKAQLRWHWLHCEDGPGTRPELRTSRHIWMLLAFLFFWLS